jgi:hypothetical protein
VDRSFRSRRRSGRGCAGIRDFVRRQRDAERPESAGSRRNPRHGREENGPRALDHEAASSAADCCASRAADEGLGLAARTNATDHGARGSSYALPQSQRSRGDANLRRLLWAVLPAVLRSCGGSAKRLTDRLPQMRRGELLSRTVLLPSPVKLECAWDEPEV